MLTWSNAKYAPPLREAPSRATMCKLDRLLRNGSSNGFAARQTGLTLQRVTRYRSLMTGLPKMCGCGERWKHPHGCWWRVNSVLRDKAALEQLRQLRRARLALQDVLHAIAS